jgi:hypothetical protein
MTSVTITFGVHGYSYVVELVQTADGRLMRRATNDFSPPLGRQSLSDAVHQLDLRAELVALRAAGPLKRPDHRVAKLEFEIDGERIEMMCAYPLVGDAPIDHPADRIFRAAGP